MDLFDGEKDAGKRRMEGCCHARCSAAGHEQRLVIAVLVEGLRDSLSSHAAEHDGRAFAAKREAGKGTERAFGELCCHDTVPGHIDAPYGFCIGLRNA